MSERLRHLQRQRARLGEHMAWLDQEIARETAAASSPPASGIPEADRPAPFPAAAPAQLQESASEADVLIEKYVAEERQKFTDVRRGCFYVFGAAILLLVSALVAVWLIFYR